MQMFLSYRELDDDNQTAILKSPWDHGFDNGTYKCVGKGIKPGDAIEHSVTVNLKGVHGTLQK